MEGKSEFFIQEQQSMTFQSTSAAKTQINRRKFLLKTMFLVSFQNIEKK
jgi:hypothetical protein